MVNKERQSIIHLHGSTKPTLQTLLDNNVQLGEIVIYHGKDEQALYILTNDMINNINDNNQNNNGEENI